jgi:hypothetical protein
VSTDPLNDLVQALHRGTISGAIAWDTADANGNDFIASRESGTVTLRGRRLSNPLTGPNPAVTLIVKDAAGKTIETYEAVPEQNALGSIIGAMSSLRSPDADLRRLYWDVKEQAIKARSTMNALAKEFQKPTPATDAPVSAD